MKIHENICKVRSQRRTHGYTINLIKKFAIKKNIVCSKKKGSLPKSNSFLSSHLMIVRFGLRFKMRFIAKTIVSWSEILVKRLVKKDSKSHIFKHLYSTTTWFDSYNSFPFIIINKANSKFDLMTTEPLHINWRKPSLNGKQNNLVLTLSV